MLAYEKALLDQAAGEGINILEAQLPGDTWGLYVRGSLTIYLQSGMTTTQRVATLLHELAHHVAGHDGHQSQGVEDQINEGVALLLVDPVEYAFWESQLGWSTGGIAHALEVPRWVVEAYRRTLGNV